MHGEPQLGRYYSLLMLFIGAMIGLVLTGSMLLLFFFWEITAFCSYALISFHNDRSQSGRRGHQGADRDAGRRARVAGGALATYALTGSYQIG